MGVDPELDHHRNGNQRQTGSEDASEEENPDQSQSFTGGHQAIIAKLVGFIPGMGAFDLEFRKSWMRSGHRAFPIATDFRNH
jgi:hypothetical protein